MKDPLAYITVAHERKRHGSRRFPENNSGCCQIPYLRIRHAALNTTPSGADPRPQKASTSAAASIRSCPTQASHPRRKRSVRTCSDQTAAACSWSSAASNIAPLLLAVSAQPSVLPRYSTRAQRPSIWKSGENRSFRGDQRSVAKCSIENESVRGGGRGADSIVACLRHVLSLSCGR